MKLVLHNLIYALILSFPGVFNDLLNRAMKRKEKLKTALRDFGHNLGHYIELYALLAVCTFLLFLEILHLVDPHWVQTAILITLMLLAIGTIRDRRGDEDLRHRLAKMTSRLGGEPGARWYARRLDAEPDMLKDLDKYKHVVFIGISQLELPRYLQGKLQHDSGTLPWESLEVYFASDLIGYEYEKNAFRENILRVRQEVAFLITHPDYVHRIPHLKHVRLFQHEGIVSHSGSMFGNSQSEFCIIYVVHSSVRLHGDTKQGLTIRLETVSEGDETHQARIRHYEEVYRRLTRGSHSLGSFAPSIWDESAQQWSSFSRESITLQNSMRELVNITGLKGNERVLDLGSGSGETSEMLLQHPGVSVVLLDGSPQMTHLARHLFNGQSRVRIALCKVPSHEWENTDLGQNKFSVIIIHQSLHHLVDAFGDLSLLADWCRQHLDANGRVAIAAHNGVVETAQPPGFKGWSDPFRAKLEKRFKKYIHHSTKKLLTKRSIREAFEKCGFQMLLQEERVFNMSFEERRQMWHVPAVMDSLIDVRKVGPEVIREAVDEIINSLRGQSTMPRTTVYWLFKAK